MNALSQASAAQAGANSEFERSGHARRQALEESRRSVTERELARADQSKARSAEQLAELREAVARRRPIPAFR
ncbi:MAG: hypothetical protein R3C42_03185 [Parvularculaceae bacterium]